MKLLRIFKKSLKYPLTVSFLLLLSGWTLIIAGIIFWSYQSINSETIILAQREAYKGYEKDVMFRSWATMHGGVYVPIDEQTQPNPYLKDIPERDITTPSKRKLTLMNPAYITRQVHELSFKKIGIIGHITSLKPIRKENAADKWEIEALNAFEKGAKEISGFDYINNEKYFRYMAPLITEQGCLKCHITQGYKLGEIRGGISSSIPWKHYQDSITSQTTKVIVGYGIIWVIGFVGISLVRKKFIIYISRRDLYEEEMQKLNEELYVSKSIIEDNLQERNNFIEEITNANDQLHKLNSEKDKFFSIIAHDLKSPFTGLIGLTEIIADDPDSFTKEEIAKMSAEINTGAKNLFKLLKNLLEWSQMQNGMISFTPKELNVVSIVNQNIALNKQRMQQKNMSVEIEIENSIYVVADENMLNSVIRNLLSNALKFTNNGGKIIIKAKVNEEQMVEFSLTDSGIGMSDKLRNKLFKIEEKVGRNGVDGEQSSGLGLLLSKEFVERHGGKIWVESEEGKGTTFLFTLPKS